MRYLPVAKLYFRYGTMDSAKTLNLLAVAHNYRKQGKSCSLMKPRIDDRFGAEMIRSRSGLEAEADVVLGPGERLPVDRFVGQDCVLVDEAQFLEEHIIDALRDLTIDHGVPVICYGLRTDFMRKLFPGSRRLLELADSIEEVKVTCFECGKKAVFTCVLPTDAASSPVLRCSSGPTRATSRCARTTTGCTSDGGTRNIRRRVSRLDRAEPRAHRPMARSAAR
ncbi:MAG: thymidine kinase [Myxococcota bacterium]